MSPIELLRWMEEEVIAMTSHPLGWEFLVCNADGEPTTEDPFLVHGTDLLEVLAEAKAEQERQIKEKEGGVHGA